MGGSVTIEATPSVDSVNTIHGAFRLEASNTLSYTANDNMLGSFFTHSGGRSMLAVMSDNEALVRLQIQVHDRTRRKLKSVSADLDLDMGEVAEIALDYLLPLIASGKAPPQIGAAIEKAKKAGEAG
jgi:hypothetical protein